MTQPSVLQCLRRFIVAQSHELPDYESHMVALLTRTLGVICPSCDFLNVVGAVRCMACGVATDGLPPISAPSARPSQAAKTAPEPSTSEAVRPRGMDRSASHQPQVPVPASPSGLRQPPPPPRPPATASHPLPRAAALKFGLAVLAGPARGQRFKLNPNGTQAGRNRGIVLFPDDPFVSPLHATLFVRDGKLVIRDEASVSGVFVSISGTETVSSGSAFCAGLRLFRYGGAIEPQPTWNRVDVLVYGAPLPNNQAHYAIEEVLLGDRPGRCVITPGPVLTIGQSRCDFSYPNDEGLAPRHCEVAPLPNGAMIRDLSGGLGTYVRVQQERTLKPGDRIRLGQQTMQVEAL